MIQAAKIIGTGMATILGFAFAKATGLTGAGIGVVFGALMLTIAVTFFSLHKKTIPKFFYKLYDILYRVYIYLLPFILIVLSILAIFFCGIGEVYADTGDSDSDDHEDSQYTNESNTSQVEQNTQHANDDVSSGPSTEADLDSNLPSPALSPYVTPFDLDDALDPTFSNSNNIVIDRHLETLVANSQSREEAKAALEGLHEQHYVIKVEKVSDLEEQMDIHQANIMYSGKSDKSILRASKDLYEENLDNLNSLENRYVELSQYIQNKGESLINDKFN